MVYCKLWTCSVHSCYVSTVDFEYSVFYMITSLFKRENVKYLAKVMVIKHAKVTLLIAIAGEKNFLS